jgi:hypothetical protein
MGSETSPMCATPSASPAPGAPTPRPMPAPIAAMIHSGSSRSSHGSLGAGSAGGGLLDALEAASRGAAVLAASV